MLPLKAEGEGMTWYKWIIVVLFGVAGVWLGIWAIQHITSLTAGLPRGPSLWDATSVVAGVALGTLLRLNLRRRVPSAKHIVAGFVGLILLGVLTFLPWNSLIRALILPILEFSTATWLTAGSASAGQHSN